MKKFKIYISLLVFLFNFITISNSQSSGCEFIITKAICSEGDDKIICLEGTNQNGTHVWDIFGGACFQTHFTGQNICFSCNFPPPSIITVVHTVIPLVGEPQVCSRYFNVSCNPNCNDWNFNSSNVNCNTILSINPNFNSPDPITWRFGDGTPSVQTPVMYEMYLTIIIHQGHIMFVLQFLLMDLIIKHVASTFLCRLVLSVNLIQFPGNNVHLLVRTAVLN